MGFMSAQVLSPFSRSGSHSEIRPLCVIGSHNRAPWVPQKAGERLERSSRILQIRTLILYVTQPKEVPARNPNPIKSLSLPTEFWQSS
jgi:hypothetical protein